MPTEMMRNYAVEASDLLTRWKRGEDVQDALAHQLRHVSAGLNTLQSEVVVLREDKARLDKLEAYLSDDSKNIGQPSPGDPTWQFGHNAGMAYCIDGGGNTLREAIDSLPN